MSKKKTGQFKTTGGSIINVPVTSSGQTVDGNKLYEAIAEAINNKKSATVEAVYSEAKEEETGEYVTYGGNYCEVDLTNQMVYVYKNGELVVSSQCVTGCISKGHGTPTGVYSIFSRDKDRYLRETDISHGLISLYHSMVELDSMMLRGEVPSVEISTCTAAAMAA